MAASGFTTTVSTKGQVILPKALREALDWTVGTRLAVEHTTDGVLLRPLTTVFAPTRPEDVFRCLPYAGKTKSIDAMAAAVAGEARRRHACGRR
jgi:AbrB family looped-hinge helix DNA binding protein